jgi:hypothetical protein
MRSGVGFICWLAALIVFLALGGSGAAEVSDLPVSIKVRVDSRIGFNDFYFDSETLYRFEV